MEIRYLYNSGFCIFERDLTMVIDYYLDTCDGARSIENGVIADDTLLRDGGFYVLASHSHGDHYNKDVLKWSESRTGVQYIFSEDILETRAHRMRKGDVFEDDYISVKAYGSTDVGISFLIRFKSDGHSLFHAGDLNNWHWMDMSTAAEAAEAQKAFIAELEPLARDAPFIDVVMFPVDPRLGSGYKLGAEQFLDRIKAGLFIPMHFGDNYGAAAQFEAYAKERGTRFARITRRGEIIK